MRQQDRPTPTTSRRVLVGFLTMTSGSLIVMFIQLVYASFTARLLTPEAFGAYAVALSAVGFIAVLSGTALGQATARRNDDDPQLDTSLLGVAVILGFVAVFVTYVAAPYWAQAWSSPDSIGVTRLLACSIPGTAIAAVSAGVLRRQGLTAVVARRTALGQIVGVLVGAIGVAAARSTVSLAVAAVVGSIVSAGLLHLRLPARHRRLARPTSASLDDLSYALKSGSLTLVRYFTNLIPLWVISRFVGADQFGGYNRAVTILTIPIETVQRSFTYSLFPEVRPGGPADSSERDVLTEVMILVTWPAVVLASCGYFLAPYALGLVLGPQWAYAQSLAGLAVLLGVAPMLAVPMSATLEAQGRFRTITLGWIVSASAIIGGATAAAHQRSAAPAMLGMIAAPLLAAVIYSQVLSRSGVLRLRRYLRGVRAILSIQFLVVCGFVAVSALVQSNAWQLAAYCLISAVEVCLLWWWRSRTSFGQVAQSYHLPGFGRGSVP